MSFADRRTAEIFDFATAKKNKEKFDLAKDFCLHVFGTHLGDEYIKHLVKETDKSAEAKKEKQESNKTTGSKYLETKDLDIKSIAKLVRSDIKEAKKTGALPESLKVSVKIDRYSMGQSLDLTVKTFEGELYNPEWVKQEKESCGKLPTAQRYTEEAQNVLETLQEIVAQYNYDNSDTTTDYFDVNFYSHITFDYSLREEKR